MILDKYGTTYSYYGDDDDDNNNNNKKQFDILKLNYKSMANGICNVTCNSTSYRGLQLELHC